MKEVRQSAWSLLHCTIVRPFNQQSVERKRATIERNINKEKIKQTKGQECTQMFGKHVDNLNVEIDAALADISDDQYNKVSSDTSSGKNKASADKIQQ